MAHSIIVDKWDELTDSEKLDEYINLHDAITYERDRVKLVENKMEELADAFVKWDTGAIDATEYMSRASAIAEWWIDINKEKED